MSKFKSYAEKVNEIAKAAFAEYRKAETEYNYAYEKTRRPVPHPGSVDAETAAEEAAEAARAQARYIEAKEKYRKAKIALTNHKEEIAALRKDLLAEVNEYYAVDPAALDSNAIELMKAGILKPNEYTTLMNNATSSGNYTMARIIAKYAGDAMTAASKQYGDNDPTVMELRRVAITANQNNGNAIMEKFDVMADLYRRTAENPNMINYWDEYAAEITDSF